MGQHGHRRHTGLALAFGTRRASGDGPTTPTRSGSAAHPTLLTRIVFVSLLMLVVTLAVFEWELRQGLSLETARTAAVSVPLPLRSPISTIARHSRSRHSRRDGLRQSSRALWSPGYFIVLQLLFVHGPMQSVRHNPAVRGFVADDRRTRRRRAFAVEAEKATLALARCSAVLEASTSTGASVEGSRFSEVFVGGGHRSHPGRCGPI